MRWEISEDIGEANERANLAENTRKMVQSTSQLPDTTKLHAIHT